MKDGFSQELGLLRAEIAAVKSQAPQKVDEAPARRSLPPELLLKPTEEKSQYPKLSAMIDKSVGL
jgi:hypothetical protein